MEDCGTTQGITKGVIYKRRKGRGQPCRSRFAAASSRVNIVNPITDEIVVKRKRV